MRSGVVHKLPGDLRKALIANPTALDAWNDITPLARRDNTWSLSDSVIWNHGKHNIRWGGDFRIRLHQPARKVFAISA